MYQNLLYLVYDFEPNNVLKKNTRFMNKNKDHNSKKYKRKKGCRRRKETIDGKNKNCIKIEEGR